MDNKANNYETKIAGIKGWRQPNQNKKIVLVGDSTTEMMPFIYSQLENFHINSGDLLSGITSDNIVNKGSNGNKLSNFITDEISSKGIKSVIDEQADLYVFCYGINDVREGECTKEQLISMIDIAITRILKETNAYVLLRTPNTLASDSPDGSIIPSNAGQQYSDLMWEAYESFRGKYARTDVIDMQSLIFGRTSLPVLNNPFLADSLHPNQNGQKYIADEIAKFIGEKPTKQLWKVKNADFGSNAQNPYMDYPKVLENNPLYTKVAQGYFVAMGNNYLDFALNNKFMSVIQKNDLIKIGDELVYPLTGTISAQGANTRILQSFTNYSNNKKGMVEIYRENKPYLCFTVRNNNLPKIVGSYCVDKNVTITSINGALDTTYTTDTFNIKLLLKRKNLEPIEICTMFSVVGDKSFRGVTWNTTNFPNKSFTAELFDFIIVECTSRTGNTEEIGMAFYLN